MSNQEEPPLFFWGHNFEKCGKNAYLSNWYPASFQDSEGHNFSDNEK